MHTASEDTQDREPDPARSYERAKPEKEAGMGRLDSVVATPADAPDAMEGAVENAHPSRQLNADELTDARAAAKPRGRTTATPVPTQPPPENPLLDEEPLGENLMPTDIHDPRHKRHPRKEGRGGTP